MKKLAKKIKGTPEPLMSGLPKLANVSVIKKIYQVGNPAFAEEGLSDHIVSRMVSKDFVS